VKEDEDLTGGSVHRPFRSAARPPQLQEEARGKLRMREFDLMEAATVSSKGLSEFQAKIAVLTKVRHRHLVGLLGYCINGGEKMLVYEYMQGPLSLYLLE
jgi:hypothetical protein